MKVQEQLNEWVKGNPIHNKERDECCPDFSCCGGQLADKDVRDRFKKACDEDDEDVKMEMLSMFLFEMIRRNFPDENIYIAGDEAAYNPTH